MNLFMNHYTFCHILTFNHLPIILCVLRIRLFDTLSKLPAIIVAAISLATNTAQGQAPVANFTASPLSGCSPLVVNFQDLSSGSPTSWNWDFGNGNTSSLQNPTAAYFTPGLYTITLTVTNAGGSHTLTRSNYISVYEMPTVNFVADNTIGCRPFPVQFTDQSSAGAGNTNVSWEWSFGNGNISTLQNPSTVYNSSGVYTVTLKVTNDKGCSRTLSKPNYINVSAGVQASFTHTQPTVCRPPASISFTNNSTGPGTLSYLWNFGDGNTSTLQNPVHTYTAAGNYTVTLITTSSLGCSDTAQTTTPIAIGEYNMGFNGPSSACVYEVLNFTNASGGNPISAWWTFGDGGTSTAINATYSYNTPGTYTIWAYYNFGYCTDSASSTITINPKPVANFTASDSVRCEPSLTVNFQDLSTGASSWLWDFGDGNTSTQQNPVHIYNNYGNYTVVLIVTSAAGCRDTLIKNSYIRINRAIISIPSLPVRGCVPFTINPVANIIALDNVTSYLWDFGDGNTSASATPTHTYPVQGTYTVSLTITTSTGCTDTYTINNAVRVGTKPVADFSAAPTTQCAYQSIQFTDLSVPADEWLWDFGDGGGSNIQNPGYTYAIPGSYTVRLIAYNNGCPDTVIKTSYISVLPPVSQFTFAANCANRTEFFFTDQSIGPVTWEWDFGDGSPVSNAQHPTHTFPSLGTYSVTLTVTNGSCTHVSTQTIIAVNENPDFIASQTVACKPFPIHFNTTNINPLNLVSYYWDFGDGVNQTTNSPNTTHNYTTSGTYTVMLVTTDINGCSDTVLKVNHIRIDGPMANFSENNTAGCAGLTTTFNDLSTNDGINNIISWQWDFGDGTVQTFPGPPFQHTYNIPGTYSVKLKITDAAGCVDSLVKTNLIVATDPIPNFMSPDTLACPNSNVRFINQSNAVNYTSTWEFGDGNSSAANSPTHTYSANGIYSVKLTITDQYGCSDSITRITYVVVDSPVADFVMSDSITACTPLQVQFTNTSHYYYSSYWDLGTGGSTTITNPVNFYNDPGIYPVKLIVTSPGGCVDSITKNITIYDTAGASIDYVTNNGCKPLTIQFNAVSPVPSDYLWDFGDGSTTLTNNPDVVHTYNKLGTFLPKLVILDPAGCLIPVHGPDSISVIGANANFGISNIQFCDQGTVNFSDSTVFNDPIVTYSWNFGDGGTSSQQNPAHTYTAPGIYSITLDVLTQNGCTDSRTLNNAVKIVASPVIDINGPNEVCRNGSLQHAGVFLQPDTSVVAWSWNFPNGNSSSQQNPNAQTYTVPGNYTITTIATNSSGCRDTATQNIIVHALPTIAMPGSMTILNGFPATIPATYSSGVVNWSWSPANGLSCTDCPQPDAEPKFKTMYNVMFTDSNGCSNFGSIVVTVICMNANLFIPNTFSPNGDGSNDQFYPRGTGLDRVKLMRVFNRWGEVVFEKRDFPINNPSAGWDGTYKGKKPLADVYVYQVEVFCENGEIIRLNGNIALIL
jgi:gliding motility-associated-like protein